MSVRDIRRNPVDAAALAPEAVAVLLRDLAAAVESLRTEHRGEADEVADAIRGIRGDVASLRGDVADLRGELRTRADALRDALADLEASLVVREAREAERRRHEAALDRRRSAVTSSGSVGAVVVLIEVLVRLWG